MTAIAHSTRPLDRVLDRLDGVTENGQGHKARCPAHADRTPSLSVRLGDDGRVLLHCHAGCTAEEVIAALGLRMPDLFPPREQRPQRVVNTTDYCILDAAGELHAIHRRLDYSDRGKTVFWLQADGSKGLDKRPLDTLPLYGSEHLAARPDEVPIVCEGEKAAQALIDAGHPALGTVTGAASAPNRDVLGVLRGRREVILWPDNDEAGRAHMARVARTLDDLGIRYRLVTWPEAPAKGDAYDFLATGGDVAALLATATAPAPAAPGTPAPRASRIVRARDLALAPPAYLIEGVLPRNSLATIVAKEASYKSFVAIGMAAAVLTGRAWAGRVVEAGPVLYLAAEGEGGVRRRLRALELASGDDLGHLWVLPAAVNFLSGDDLDRLADEVAALDAPPALIVVDTLARNMHGNENAAEDMGRFVAACDRLRTLTGACVLIIHHENKLGGYRGSTAFAAAMDTMIEARREGTAVTLTCKKQKEDGEFAPIHLAARVVDLGIADRHGRPVTSIVLQPTDAAFVEQQRQAASGERALSEKERKLLAIIADAPGGQLTYSEWHHASGLAQSTFDYTRKRLIDRGLVCALGNRGYAITPTPGSPPSRPNGGVPPTPTPLMGMGVGVDLEEGDEDDDPDELPF